MFAVVYEFVIQSGTDEKFREAWIEHTEYVYQTQGSLGSRLHTTGVANTYVAYAQWTEKARWLETSEVFRDTQPSTLKKMKKYLINSSIIKELTVCDDILK
nr:antibiotic biosynthesis monooxygenase [uncultured Vibrio sp.]